MKNNFLAYTDKNFQTYFISVHSCFFSFLMYNTSQQERTFNRIFKAKLVKKVKSNDFPKLTIMFLNFITDDNRIYSKTNLICPDPVSSVKNGFYPNKKTMNISS